MNSDRELLEAAAKAAGMETRWDQARGAKTGVVRARVPGSGDAFPVWDPLTDDGDAFRLAVKLGFIRPAGWPDAGLIALEQWGADGGAVDWCAATRRAIVRAAAAMVTA